MPKFNRKAKAIFLGNEMYLTSHFASLFNDLLRVINGKIPSGLGLRAISPVVTAILIIAVIAVGGIIIYFLVVNPGITTTHPYP